MEVSLSSVRDLGYKKVDAVFLTERFFEDLKDVSFILSSIKVSQHTFLRHRDAILSCNNSNLLGVKCLIELICPSSEEVDIDLLMKRRFSNIFESIWKKYRRSSDINDFQYNLLFDTALRLPVLLANFEDGSTCGMMDLAEESIAEINRVADFMNAVLLWGFICNSETVLIDEGHSILSLISILALHNNCEFVEWLSNADLVKHTLHHTS